MTQDPPLPSDTFDRLCSEIVVAASRCSHGQLTVMMEHLKYVAHLRANRLEVQGFQNLEVRRPAVAASTDEDRAFDAWEERGR